MSEVNRTSVASDTAASSQHKPWESHPWWPKVMIWLEQQKHTHGQTPQQVQRRLECAGAMWNYLMEVERGLWDDRFDRLCIMLSNCAIAGIGRVRTFTRPLFEDSLKRRGVPIPALIEPAKRVKVRKPSLMRAALDSCSVRPGP